MSRDREIVGKARVARDQKRYLRSSILADYFLIERKLSTKKSTLQVFAPKTDSDSLSDLVRP